MKKIGLIMSIFFIVLTGVVHVSDLFSYPEDIEFGGEKNRGAVEFPHELHMEEFECLDCHHIMENGQNILDESDLEEDDPAVLCSSCHNSQSKIEKKEAFHYQCMGCHNNYSLTPEATGPTLCGGCHILKKNYHNVSNTWR